MKLKNTNAVITGATGRLGSEIALDLANAGLNCVCHYNSNTQLAESLVNRIQKLGRKAIAVRADLTHFDQVESLFVKAEKFGIPRILVNSAAVFSRQPLNEVTLEEVQKTINTNLVAPILTSRLFSKILTDRFDDLDKPLGKIINLVDIGGIRPWPGYSIYCASKAGLIALTKSLAKELAPAFTVNAVAPGIIDTPDELDEDGKKRQLSRIPAGRFGLPKEITSAIIFLLENDYITGQVLNVDGGKCI
jgi:NAD(P)-dependent dehydrogenase (short-subunit alcohol dehydrogenase family)